MKNYKKIVLSIVFMCMFAFTCSEVTTYAVTKKTSKKVAKKTTSKKSSTSSKSAAKKKTTSTKTAKKKSSKAKKTTSKKKKIVRSKSRGSYIVGRTGRVLGDVNADELISIAKRYMGVHYVFGGSSPSGFDCSGFTMFVFDKMGINLPHTAAGQATLGQSVPKSELQKGDLVFFETYKPGISHVGIYIGEGKFIHASSSKGITVTALSESYYAARYVGATRIIN